MKRTTKTAVTPIATSTSLKEKSESAINAFKTLISDLKATNDEGAAAKAANTEQMNKLAAENAAIDALTAQNEKIVSNIEGLLGL